VRFSSDLPSESMVFPLCSPYQDVERDFSRSFSQHLATSAVSSHLGIASDHRRTPAFGAGIRQFV